MSNRLPILPVFSISSLIQAESELLSKKSAELSAKSIDEYKSDESIKLGDGIPSRKVTTRATATYQTQYKTNDLLYISGIILFLVVAFLCYYFYINYRKK